MVLKETFLPEGEIVCYGRKAILFKKMLKVKLFICLFN